MVKCHKNKSSQSKLLIPLSSMSHRTTSSVTLRTDLVYHWLYYCMIFCNPTSNTATAQGKGKHLYILNFQILCSKVFLTFSHTQLLIYVILENILNELHNFCEYLSAYISKHCNDFLLRRKKWLWRCSIHGIFKCLQVQVLRSLAKNSGALSENFTRK